MTVVYLPLQVLASGGRRRSSRGQARRSDAVIIVNAIGATIFSLVVLSPSSVAGHPRACGPERALHLPEQRVHQPEHAAGVRRHRPRHPRHRHHRGHLRPDRRPARHNRDLHHRGPRPRRAVRPVLRPGDEGRAVGRRRPVHPDAHRRHRGLEQERPRRRPRLRDPHAPDRGADGGGGPEARARRPAHRRAGPRLDARAHRARVVVPAAKTGIITAAILGVARVIGETAPLLLTARNADSTVLNPFAGRSPRCRPTSSTTSPCRTRTRSPAPGGPPGPHRPRRRPVHGHSHHRARPRRAKK